MTVLELRGAARSFPGGAGLAPTDLALAPGEVLALVGMNGAGKTTLMRLALGMLRPDRGEVRLVGVPLDRLPAPAWGAVGHLIEVPFAYPELTVRENLEVAAALHGAPAGVTGPALARWALGAVAGRRVRRLSLGTRQRVGLAAALQHAPTLAVLDEPANALDPAGVLALRDAVRERADAGGAVLVSSHHLDEVARIADRILVLNAGRVVAALDPAGTDLERAFFECVRADDVARAA